MRNREKNKKQIKRKLQGKGYVLIARLRGTKELLEMSLKQNIFWITIALQNQ